MYNRRNEKKPRGWKKDLLADLSSSPDHDGAAKATLHFLCLLQ
jgi:hypothetical protein